MTTGFSRWSFSVEERRKYDQNTDHELVGAWITVPQVDPPQQNLQEPGCLLPPDIPGSWRFFFLSLPEPGYAGERKGRKQSREPPIPYWSGKRVFTENATGSYR